MVESVALLQKKITQAIPKLDKRNRYQILLVIFVVLKAILDSVSDTMPDFIFQNPLFECNGESTTQEEACQILDQCKITNDYTAIVPTGLYCDNEDFRSVIQSMSTFGGIAGMLTIVPFGDFGGKKLTIIISIGLHIIGAFMTILGIQFINWTILIIGQLLIGISYAGFDIASYVMMAEYLPDKLCQMALLFTCSAWGVSQMFFLPIYYYIPQWYNCMWLTVLIPNIGFFIISFFFLVQHPTFCLFKKKNIDQFTKNIEQIKLYNNSDQGDIQQLKQLAKKYIQASEIKTEKQPQSKKKQLKQYLVRLYCSRKNLIPLICLTSVYSGYLIYYNGMADSMQRSGYNYGVTMFLSGIPQVVCYLLFNLVVNKIGRKKGLAVSIIITSVTGLLFIVPFIKDSSFLQSVALFISTAFGVFTYSFFVLLQVESFPTSLMSSAQGTIQSISQISLLFVPYLVIKMNDLGIHPVFASSAFLLILGLIPAFILRQTLGSFKSTKNIQQNVLDGEQQISNTDSLLNSSQNQS